MASVCKTCSNTKCQMYGEAFLKECKEYVPMGVEERAEQYADKKVENRTGYNARWELVKKAYIAGYNDALEKVKDIKADYEVYKKSLSNSVKWHKVADGDLPKDEEEKLLFVKNDRYVTDSYSENVGWTFTPNNKVIAWCEIPRYEGV